MDDTRSDDLIRRNHELLAAAAKAWSDFMETVARRRGCGVRFGTGRPRLCPVGPARAWSERTDPTYLDHQSRLTTLTGCWTGWSEWTAHHAALA
jgi:hypothetical protein